MGSWTHLGGIFFIMVKQWHFLICYTFIVTSSGQQDRAGSSDLVTWLQNKQTSKQNSTLKNFPHCFLVGDKYHQIVFTFKPDANMLFHSNILEVGINLHYIKLNCCQVCKIFKNFIYTSQRKKGSALHV